MTEWIGKTLGKVQIESPIARGGVAEIYLGTHTTLQRKVAVKILRGQFEDDPNLLERFQREAVVVSRLRHPNIVQVYDFDSIEGHPYLVMEHVAGPSLSRYLDAFHAKGKRLDLPTISRLLTSVASALEYAHKMGVIHRDVKPGNILLTSHTAQVIAGITMPVGFEPILTDFGLVRFLNSSRHTAAGHIAGTPAYMSPEQARGEVTDGRTDIYSLGIVLYEMLSGGRVPYEGETTMSILMKKIHEPVQPIPGLAPSLQDILDRALARDKADRYATPMEFALEFQTAVSNLVKVDTFVHGPPEPPAPERRARSLQRWWPALTVGFFAAMVAFYIWLGRSSSQEAAIIPDTGGDTPAAVTTVTAAPVQVNPSLILRFRTGSAFANLAELTAQAIPPPPSGKQYEVWLVGSAERQSLGLLTLDDEGNGGLIYTADNGTALIGQFERAEVTLENNPDSDPGTSGLVVYAYNIPLEAVVHVRHLLASSPDTPEEKPILNGMISSIELILQSTHEMKEEFDNNNAAGVIQRAESVLNLLAGDQDADYKDWNRDGELQDPLDGYGLQVNGLKPGYIQAAYSAADLVMNAPGVTPAMSTHGSSVITCTQNLAEWAAELRENVLTILNSTVGSNLAQPIARSVVLADQLLKGTDIDGDQSIEAVEGECGAEIALEHAYAMADMPLVPVSPPSPLALTGTAGAPSSTPTLTPIFVSPTHTPEEFEATAAPPQPTRPGNSPGNRPEDPPGKPTKDK